MNVAVLIARVIIGGVLLAAGALKVGHFDWLASEIAAYRILPGNLVAPLAVGLPLIEILVGAYLIAGLYTRAAGWIALIEFVVFAAAITSVVVRGISAPCGCFGPGDVRPASWNEVGRDVVLALITAFIIWRAPGALAVDSRLNPPA
ncbi:MAG: DoxX family membrane protein [Candidatus Eremiobacteraeota bacterium]|nr:DoxX family membrane protein [Candidatus Eremiobacteraeota bacterium]MBV8353966.1 DoxX family membrane protein [Candidatus Eremiobacteraeota bacterium]